MADPWGRARRWLTAIAMVQVSALSMTASHLSSLVRIMRALEGAVEPSIVSMLVDPAHPVGQGCVALVALALVLAFSRLRDAAAACRLTLLVLGGSGLFAAAGIVEAVESLGRFSWR